MAESTFQGLGLEERHRLLIDATVPSLSDAAIVSHQSAAVLYGLPLWRPSLDRVHVTRDRRNGGRIKDRLIVHCASLDRRVAEIDGYLVTTPARTVLDVARTLPFEQSVIIGDAAVRRFGIDAEELEAELEFGKRRRGTAAARRVVAFLDGRSESVGESRSRVMILRTGLAAAFLSQGVVSGPDGRFVGRTDFYAGALLGEFDGRIKYGRLLEPGQDAGDAVFAEKLREDALRDLGYQVARWTWGDLEAPAHTADRLRRALERASKGLTPTGNVVQAPLPTPRAVRFHTL